VITADANRGVVVQKCLGQADDRVGERRRLGGGNVGARGHFVGDKRLHTRDRPRLDDAGARSEQPHRASRLLLEEPAQRRRLSEATVRAVEHIEQPGRPAAPDLRSLAGNQQLELVRDDLTDERFTRAKPAVDGRAAEPQLPSDNRQIDSAPVKVLLGHRAYDVCARCRGRSAPFSCCQAHRKTLVFETSEGERIEMPHSLRPQIKLADPAGGELWDTPAVEG